MGQSRGSNSQIGAERAKTSTKNLRGDPLRETILFTDYLDADYLRSARPPTFRKDLSSLCVGSPRPSCGRYQSSVCYIEPHVLGSAYEIQNEPHRERSPTLALVGDDNGVEEANPPPPRLQLTRSRRQDVLHPIALRSVGKGDDVRAVGAKGVDGGAVRAARLSTDVAHYGEPRYVTGHPQGQAVGEMLVEASYSSRCWHLTSSFSCSLSLLTLLSISYASRRGVRGREYRKRCARLDRCALLFAEAFVGSQPVQ